MKTLTVSILIYLSIMSPIATAGTCRSFFRSHAVVKQQVVAAPVAQVYTPVYYGVGHQLQQQAINQKQIEAIVTAAVQAALQARDQTSSPQVQPQFQPQQTSAIQKHCGSCHGPEPKNGASETLTLGNLRCEVITESLRMMRDDVMPDKRPPLTPEQKGAVMNELLNNQAR